MHPMKRPQLLGSLLVLIGVVAGFPPRGWPADSPPPAVDKAKAPAAIAPSRLLTLPPQCFAVAGQELRIDFGNLLPPDAPQGLYFAVALDGKPHEPAAGETLPTAGAKRFAWKPGEDAVGRHQLTVSVRAADGKLLGKLLDEATTELCVAPAAAGAGRDLALLIVGDSLTHATLYPNEWARLLGLPGNPKWTMLGTHRPASASAGVAHEGYGGWRWSSFVSRYEPKPDPAKRIRSSPFVFVGAERKPELDVPRYFQESCGGRRPDVVTFLLGINDCFAAPSQDRAALDRHIDGVLAEADRLLAAFHAAAPAAKLAVCLTPPPNARDAAFVANYKTNYPRAGWLRIQSRLVERQLEYFAHREAEQIFVVPTELDIDVVDGYPENNAVHPNAAGYARLAATLHAWLKWRLHIDSMQ
jgi:lysophospholipase L1-like esterase